MAEEFFDSLEFGVGHIQIFLGVFRILFLHKVLRFIEVSFHTLLGGDDVAAKPVARCGLLALKIVQSLRRGDGAAVHFGIFLFDFLSLSSGLGLCLRGRCSS